MYPNTTRFSAPISNEFERILRFVIVALLAVITITTSLSIVAATPSEAAEGDSGGLFVPVTPTRIADTNNGTNTTKAPLTAGSVRSIKVTGVGGVPATDVGAVILDVGGASSTAALLYAYPDGGTRASSFMTFLSDGSPDSNTVIVKPGANGRVAFYNSAGSTNINIDVQGYFTEVSGEGASGGFQPINPTRLVGTNTGVGLPKAKVAGGNTYTAQISDRAGIPSDATAVFANVRVLNANVDGGLKIIASNAAATSAYAVNYQSGDYNDTGLSIKLGPDGKIKIISTTSGSTLDLIIDVQGYFSGKPHEGGSYTPQQLADRRHPKHHGDTCERFQGHRRQRRSRDAQRRLRRRGRDDSQGHELDRDRVDGDLRSGPRNEPVGFEHFVQGPV